MNTPSATQRFALTMDETLRSKTMSYIDGFAPLLDV